MKNNIKTLSILLLSATVILWSCDDKDYTVLPDPIEQLSVSSISSTEGFIGDELTITGTNFSLLPSNNKVLFDGVAAIVKSASETELIVEIPKAVPNGQASATVPVTVSHGQFTTDAGSFLVNKPIVTLVVALEEENDDVEEVTELDEDPDEGVVVGTMDLSSSDLELGEISSGQGLMNIGIRYNNITIPEGAVISEAYIQFKTDNDGSDPVELTIYAENTANAEAYTEEVGNLSARPLTTANVVWSIPEWVDWEDFPEDQEDALRRGDAQKTINIASLIQEIIDRDDWAPGNSINIIMKPSGVSIGVTSSSGGREAENYSSSSEDDGAELTVVYQ